MYVRRGGCLIRFGCGRAAELDSGSDELSPRNQLFSGTLVQNWVSVGWYLFWIETVRCHNQVLGPAMLAGIFFFGMSYTRWTHAIFLAQSRDPFDMHDITSLRMRGSCVNIRWEDWSAEIIRSRGNYMYAMLFCATGKVFCGEIFTRLNNKNGG